MLTIFHIETYMFNYIEKWNLFFNKTDGLKSFNYICSQIVIL